MTTEPPKPELTKPTPSRAALREALALSEEILQALESGDTTLTQLALKAARMAQRVGNDKLERLFRWEASGYQTNGPLPPEKFQAAIAAGRRVVYTNPKTNQEGDRVYVESIDELMARRKGAEALLARSTIWMERQAQGQLVQDTTRQLATCRASIHRFTSNINHALKFAGVADDVFARTSARVTRLLATKIPTAADHVAAVYKNLESENPEDWANAVHSCRRLLKDLADAVYAPRAAIARIIAGKPKEVLLGEDQYVNRLMTFAEEHSGSERFNDLVGANLTFLGDRLDSINSAANKGTHARVTKEEADRYVIYSFLLVGDILSLLAPEET